VPFATVHGNAQAKVSRERRRPRVPISAPPEILLKKTTTAKARALPKRRHAAPDHPVRAPQFFIGKMPMPPLT